MAEKYVVQGATCTCSLGATPTTLNVTSHTIKKIEGKLQATINDKTFAGTFGTCNISAPPPACVISPTNWINFAQSTRISGNLVLLKGSQLGCARGGLISIQNENQNISENSEVPTNKIDKVYNGEVHFRRMLDEIDAAGVHTQPFNKGDYAVFANSTSNLIKTQSYGFDWIRDVLDGEENYYESKIGNIDLRAKLQELSPTKSYYGKFIHKIVQSNPMTRKVEEEYFYFLVAIDCTISGKNITLQTPLSEIWEYDKNRNKINAYNNSHPEFAEIQAKTGVWNTVTSPLLLTSFNWMTRDFPPVTQYINTPKGTLSASRNLSKAIYEINDKNYYVPWLTVMRGKTVKVQALSFLDSAPPPGEIRLNSSSSELTINPTIIPIPPLYSYPIAYPGGSIPVANIELIDITCSNTGIEQDEIIEVRFFDNSKIADSEYKGEVIGLLNILANKPHYTVDCHFIRVWLTDSTNMTGIGFPLNPVIVADPQHDQATQLARSQTLKSYFNRPGGVQDKYMELMFGQALIEYNIPLAPVHPITDIPIDFSAFLPAGTIIQNLGTDEYGGHDPFDLSNTVLDAAGNVVENLTNLVDQNFEDFLRVLSASRNLNNGVTYFLLPYRMGSTYGWSDGIGGAAKSVMITKLMADLIASDRATGIHEGAHSLNLYHSFADGGENINTYICNYNDRPYVFLNEETENVMDYTAAGRSFFKWQWEKMQNDHPDVTQIL